MIGRFTIRVGRLALGLNLEHEGKKELLTPGSLTWSTVWLLLSFIETETDGRATGLREKHEVLCLDPWGFFGEDRQDTSNKMMMSVIFGYKMQFINLNV